MPVNILATLPPSNSPKGSLNKLDWLKILRVVVVQSAATVAVLTAQHYDKPLFVYHDQDITPEVLVAANGAAELIRRLIMGGVPQPVETGPKPAAR